MQYLLVVLGWLLGISPHSVFAEGDFYFNLPRQSLKQKAAFARSEKIEAWRLRKKRNAKKRKVRLSLIIPPSPPDWSEFEINPFRRHLKKVAESAVFIGATAVAVDKGYVQPGKK